MGLNTKPVEVRQPPSKVFASNDSGDVTWNVPTGIVNFAASVPAYSLTTGRRRWPTSPIAHKGSVVGRENPGGQHARSFDFA